MSSSSVARQNRRMKQLRIPEINSLKKSQIFMLSPTTLDSNAECDKSSNFSQKSVELGLCNNLEKKIMEENDSDNKETFAPSTGCSFVQCDVSSRPIGKVYIEDEKGFKAISLDESLAHHSANPQPTEFKTELAIHLACRTARYFQNMSNFFHGILGGMSLLHILFLFQYISSDAFTKDTLKQFSFLSQPVHNVFNFLCIICCISAFDRYDIGNHKQLFEAMRKRDFKIVVVIIYPICLLLSLTTANVDEKFYMPQANLTATELLKRMEYENELFYWKTLSISKCFGAVLGWIIISWNTNRNLFYEQLKRIAEKSKHSEIT